MIGVAFELLCLSPFIMTYTGIKERIRYRKAELNSERVEGTLIDKYKLFEGKSGDNKGVISYTVFDKDYVSEITIPNSYNI